MSGPVQYIYCTWLFTSFTYIKHRVQVRSTGILGEVRVVMLLLWCMERLLLFPSNMWIESYTEFQMQPHAVSYSTEALTEWLPQQGKVQWYLFRDFSLNRDGSASLECGQRGRAVSCSPCTEGEPAWSNSGVGNFPRCILSWLTQATHFQYSPVNIFGTCDSNR